MESPRNVVLPDENCCAVVEITEHNFLRKTGGATHKTRDTWKFVAVAPGRRVDLHEGLAKVQEDAGDLRDTLLEGDAGQLGEDGGHEGEAIRVPAQGSRGMGEDGKAP